MVTPQQVREGAWRQSCVLAIRADLPDIPKAEADALADMLSESLVTFAHLGHPACIEVEKPYPRLYRVWLTYDHARPIRLHFRPSVTDQAAPTATR